MKNFKIICWLLLPILVACNPVQKNPTDAGLGYDPNAYQVGFLIMDGVYNTELTAPYDIFHHTLFRENIKPMQVFTIAGSNDMIRTFEGLKIKPDYSYSDGQYPPIDILVVPSAEHHLDTDLENKDMIRFVKKTAEKAQYICSHCDGAFVLAKAGLLENRVSTTFPSDIHAMRDMFPELDIREDLLFVHDRNIITSAGGAKSFEASLYLAELLYGKKIAEDLAAGLVIDWDFNQIKHLIISE